MYKFIHAADIHLDSPLRGLERYEGAPVETIRGATRRAFENLVDLAIDEQVAFVLIAGDLYDGSWKDYNTGLFLVKQMAQLKEAGIRVFIVAGNHDAASQITKVLRPPDNVKIFSSREPESVVLDEFDVAIHGQGFARRAVTDDMSIAYPSGDSALFNIGLLHTSLDGRPGHEAYAPCSVDGLRAKGYQYWALGHVHRREEVSIEPHIVFPGNLQGRHIRETGAKGCTLVSVSEDEIESSTHCDLDVLRWQRVAVDVTDTTAVDDVYDQVRESFIQAIEAAGDRTLCVRLKLTGHCAAHTRLRAQREHWIEEFRALAGSLGDGTLWLEKVELDTKRPADLKQAMARDDALGGLLRAIHSLEFDNDRLAAMTDEFKDLRAKLPHPLLAGDDPLDPSDPAPLQSMLEDVKELLLARLLQGGR